MNKKTKLLFELMFYVAVVFLSAYNLYDYYMTPVVYWSTSKNECVKIEIDGEVFDCSNLPEKYERIWVK